MPRCKGQLRWGYPCPNSVKRGQTLCRWHNPDDRFWTEIYVRLHDSKPEMRTEILIELIEGHPSHDVVLPKRGEMSAMLREIDFSPEALDVRRSQNGKEGTTVDWLMDYEHLRGSGAGLSFANLRGAVLVGAQLQRASLFWTDFQEADLVYVDFSQADLSNCNLRQSHLDLAILTKANLTHADLEDAYLENAHLEGASLKQANLQGAYFNNTNLEGANLAFAKLSGVDLSNAQSILNVSFNGAELDKTKIRREQLGNAIAEEQNGDYPTAKQIYISLKQNFHDLGDYEAASWAYRKERRMEKLEARKKFEEWTTRNTLYSRMKYGVVKQWYFREAAVGLFKYIGDTLVEWLCDYGESVWHVIGWIVALLFFIEPLTFTLLGGFAWDSPLAHYYFALSSSWNRFWFSYRLQILYSLGDFSTANFSGLQPANDAVKLASGIFSIFGIFLVGLLGFVAGNRIRRS